MFWFLVLLDVFNFRDWRTLTVAVVKVLAVVEAMLAMQPWMY